MVEKLRGAYELVLLLGPPVLDEPGPCLAVAAQADAVLAAAARGDSRRPRRTRGARRDPALAAARSGVGGCHPS